MLARWCACILVSFSLSLGCSRGAPTAPPVAPAAEEGGPAVQILSPGEQLIGLFDLRIDPGFTSAAISQQRRLTAQPPQALSYDLDIAKFLSPATLSVQGLGQTSTEVLVTIGHAHPFAAPDFTLPITGKNRADLSYTGRLLILADQNVQTVTVPGEGTYRFDPGWVANPDGYLPVGDLLAQQEFVSNVFPYLLLVDEAADNRVNVSNGGEMTGNYTPGDGGWQRANAGDTRDAWTGYDYLHAGQRVTLTLRIRKSDLAASNFTMPLAILIKYTDPRGEPGPFARFPFEPVDVTRFAYRLPYAALDASQCAWCDRLDVSGLPNVARASVTLRDWDTGATAAPDANLSDESDVSLVQPGAQTAPIVEVVAPAMLPAPVPLTLLSGSGLPGDELRYGGTLTNQNGVDGAGWMFFRARDPEFSDPEFANYHFGVDPHTITPDATRALAPQTLMPVYIRAWPSSSWARAYSAGANQSSASLTPTPQGTFLLAAAYSGPANDQDPAECAQPVPYAGSSDMALQELDESGNLLRRWVWADPAYNNLWHAVADADGNIYVTFSFEAETRNWQPRTMDFDPGPGTDNHTSVESSLGIVKLDPAGNYVWGRQLDDARYTGTGWLPGIMSSGIAVNAAGDIAISGTCFQEIDLDPGPDVFLVDTGSWADWFISVMDSSGSFLWGLSDTGSQYEYCSAPLWKQNGNVALTGRYSHPMDIDPGPGTQELPEPADSSAGFRAEWSRTGTVIRAAAWSAGSGEFGDGLAILEALDGSEYLVGQLQGGGDLDLTAGIDLRTTPGAPRVFFSRYSPTWEYQWTHIFEIEPASGFNDALYGAGVQPDGSLVLGLTAHGFALDADPSPATALLGEEGGPWYGWASYNPSGSFKWLRELRRTDSIFLEALTVAPNGRLLLNWNGRGEQDVDPGPGTLALTLPNFGFAATYLQADGTW